MHGSEIEANEQNKENRSFTNNCVIVTNTEIGQ